MKHQVVIDCKVCHNEKAMIPSKIVNKSDFFYNLGWIMILLSSIMLVVYIICFIGISNNYQGHPMYRLGQCFMMSFIIAYMAILVKGISFITKKEIFKCKVCGSIIDRG